MKRRLKIAVGMFNIDRTVKVEQARWNESETKAANDFVKCGVVLLYQR